MILLMAYLERKLCMRHCNVTLFAHLQSYIFEYNYKMATVALEEV